MFEKVSKGLMIWVLLSLVLKCSVSIMDTYNTVKKVGYDYREINSTLKVKRGG